MGVLVGFLAGAEISAAGLGDRAEQSELGDRAGRSRLGDRARQSELGNTAGQSKLGDGAGRGRFLLARVVATMASSSNGQGGADGSQQQGPAMVSADQIDRLVKQRLEQAFNGVFGRLLSTSERAAQAAETQASAHKSDSLVKGLKIDPFRPSSREEELKQWKEWWFSFMNYVSGHDAAYERDIPRSGWRKR